MGIEGVVKVVAWAMSVLLPSSKFHEANLVPVPEARPQMALEDTVRESPNLYHPSEVSDARE